ncbi:MAG: sulfite exporter TauE/SafE family protein, partial [Thermodesulfobacteriota bacterium]|nr:sulfite exporter TauE/SafE family protein [Thermodesulfobacteriota bacterium]
MNFFRQWGEFMMMGARALAKWEINNSNTILGDRKRLAILGLLLVPIIIGGVAFAEHFVEPLGDVMPEVLGGHKAYSPAFYNTAIFIVSI